MGGIHTFSGTQASAFLNASIAEDTDALSAFRLGGGLRLRAEFPVLVNLAYRFPIWPGQDRVHLQRLADYARADYVRDHHLPRRGLTGVGANLSVALTKGFALVVGYGYGIEAPRGHAFGGHDVDTPAPVGRDHTARRAGGRVRGTLVPESSPDRGARVGMDRALGDQNQGGE